MLLDPVMLLLADQNGEAWTLFYPHFAFSIHLEKAKRTTMASTIDSRQSALEHGHDLSQITAPCSFLIRSMLMSVR